MIPYTSSSLTLDWLNSVLSDQFETKIDDFSTETIGGGAGVLGEITRIHLSCAEVGGAPKTLIGKFSAPVKEAREAAGSMSFYDMENRFYSEMVHRLPVRAPKCFYQKYVPESQEFVLLMEDVEGEVVDQLTGCTLEQAKTAVDTLVELHTWGERFVHDFPWLRPLNDEQFMNAVNAALEQNVPLTLERFSNDVPDWLREHGPSYPEKFQRLGRLITGFSNQTVVHGDYRADNLVFNSDGRQTTLDWQIILRAPGCFDLGYFISQSLSVELRRDHGENLIGQYLEGLSLNRIQVDEIEFRENLKVVLTQNLTYPLIGGGIMDESFDRSRKLIETMLSRACCAFEDFDCFAYL